MAVYEHTYQPYAGEMTTAWSRFLIIPRHAYRNVFGSKLFVAIFALGFIYPLAAAILIYLHHNVNAIGLLQLDIRQLLPVNTSFFETFVMVQCTYAFFLNLLLGPPLLARDLTNNALPLYLCRPISRAEYVLGKASVLLILLSLVTWIPALLLFLFKAYLEGWSWLASNLWVAGAMFAGCWVWLIVISLLSLAVSAWVKWRVIASATLLGIFFIPVAFGELINSLFSTRWGRLIAVPNLIAAVWEGLFGNFNHSRRARTVEFERDGQWVLVQLFDPPLWISWVMLSLLCALCLFILYRKVRAYEVVRG